MRALPLCMLLACTPKIDVGPTLQEQLDAPLRVVEQPDDQAIGLYLQAAIAAGSAWDPVGREGVAALTAHSLLEGGAGDRTGTELKRELYRIGAELDLVVDREWVSIRLACHPDHAETCVDLFADLVVRPRFEADAVGRARDEAAYALGDGALEDIEALGGEVLNNWLFEAHPYGHPVRGRTGVLDLLDDAAVRAFHKSHYLVPATTVGLAGRYDEALRDRFVTALSALPASPQSFGDGEDAPLPIKPPELPLKAPLPVEGRSLVAVQVDGDATGFHLGHPVDLPRSHADWPAVHLALTHFGAHRQSFGRLFQSLREERGLNYGTYAYVEPYVQRGWDAMPEQGTVRTQPHFSLWIRPTTHENAPFALKLAIDELERLVADGLTEDEVEATKAYLSRRNPIEAPTPDRRLAYALEAAASGQPDPQTTLAERLATLTAAEVNAAIQRHLRPADLRIVAISGDSEGLIARLGEETPTPIVYAGVTPSEAQAATDARVAEKTLDLAQTHAVSALGIFR